MKKLLFILSLFFITSCNAEPDKPEITVYKSPTCGCCSKWITHLEDNGFKVFARDVANVDPVKVENGLPYGLGSCHTGLVNGYVIEGHVPASDIHRLLEEKPAIKGLAVPGMPIGSPGMEQGDKKDAYDVVAFDEEGNLFQFSHHAGNTGR